MSGPLLLNNMAMATTSLLPQSRRRESVEIIDVDELDDDILQQAPSRPAQRRRVDPELEVFVIDSDDDEDIGASTSSSSSGARSQRLRSLPPPAQDPTVPPVPRIPRRFAGQQGFLPPIRRHPPPYPEPSLPGVVRPNAQPFPFESHLSAPSSREGSAAAWNSRVNRNSGARPAPPDPPMHAAPPSHHQPAMGFGGALISLSRFHDAIGRTQRRNQPAPAPRARGWHQTWFSHIFPEDDLFEDGLMPPNDMMMRTMGATRSKEPEYKNEYTHPGKPEPGFVFDFAPASDDGFGDSASASTTLVTSSENPIVILDDDDDAPGPSSSTSKLTGPSSPAQVRTQLVCAGCKAPLLLGNQTATKGPEEEKRRKIWGLRCGHLIDGACLDEISRPAPPLEPTEPTEAPVKDKKGKGKAKTIAPEPTPAPAPMADDDVYAPPDGDFFFSGTLRLPDGSDSGQRYSLRPRRTANGITTITIHPQPVETRSSARQAAAAAPASAPSTGTSAGPGPRSRPAAKTSRGRGGGRGKPKTETFVWHCPVAGCGKEHASVRVRGGEWEMEKDTTAGTGMLMRVTRSGRGAIPVFV
ncbi:hypothetical protein HGRIS_000961 [Hohenbuehelia grisea]|uniref:Uncharacterized protein n=1 Tax=Hohenbuehelia grisea TaxID=104357 RepID=A0ABR3IQA7_9AGAR